MSTAAVPAVEVRDLRRTFVTRRGPRRARTERVALDGVNLRVERGETHGLLGPNGAGKTTLMKILATLLVPTSGQARVLGYDVVGEHRRVREVIGLVLGGDNGLYGSLSARRNLLYWATLAGLDGRAAARRVDLLLERFGLAERADSPTETFSRGMRQRLHLARGLVGDSAVLILDEPTNGMDPVAALAFRDVVRELQGEGRTLLLATHDMAEAEQLCERVTLVDGGRVLATEAPHTLGGWLTRYEYVDAEGVPPGLVAELADLPGVDGVEPGERGGIRVRVVAEGTTHDVLTRLVAAGVTTIRTDRMSLQDIYLRMVGHRELEV
ncbi:ABC transporter ATP-binding protein [Actinokineospora enzanensis]|uniref:ABC transporter ATP-binding protein n=1 Tax=Actinokineospora enzanensis TaxID=155975 RepID=UPI00036A6023|nr:ABC transporter ATP-binding protein [Actinokineospora enzanensis]